jgi:hypothetical protein
MKTDSCWKYWDERNRKKSDVEKLDHVIAKLTYIRYFLETITNELTERKKIM